MIALKRRRPSNSVQVRRYRQFNDYRFPPGSRSGLIIDTLAEGFRVAMDEGPRSLLERVIERYIRRRKHFFRLSRDEQYQVWLANNRLTLERLREMETEAAQFAYAPKISILMPVYNSDEKWLRLAIDSVINQVYRDWELCVVDDASTRTDIKQILESYAVRDRRIKVRYLEENRGISGASNEALGMAGGDFVGCLDHDDELTRDALFEIVKVLNENPNLDFIYSDHDKKDLDGRRVEPFFKPDWSPDLLLSMNYVSHFSVTRKSLVDHIGGFRLGFEGSQDHDLILRVTESTDRIAHVPKPLYSWRKAPSSAAASMKAKPYAGEAAKKALREALTRRGLLGTVTDSLGGRYRVRHAIRGAPLVSIIIPTRDRVDLLKRCIESIEPRTSHRNYEIVIVDNNSVDPATLAYLESSKHTIVKFDEPFNFSKINNLGTKYAKGDHLLFLNNDTEVVGEYWLEAMLEHSQRPEVGMVGALLLYPNGSRSHRPSRIQHAGVTIGVGGVAGHAFKHLPADRSNYYDLHRVIRNCSAVTAACAMMRRSVFDEVGGFDEKLKVAFGDVDLCLRVRESGYRVVYTPYAMVYHHECATRGRLHPAEDEAYAIDRWGDAIIKGDPYYNPNLTLLRQDYSLASKGSSIRPLAILLDVFYLRPDLQRAYPEARKGDYRRLIKWASTSGTKATRALQPYVSYFASNASDHVEGLSTEKSYCQKK
jgi:GT2 family glycosyltransferase